MLAITSIHKTKTVMKKIIFFLFVILISECSFAQKLNIRVLDSLTNEPINAASIYFKNGGSSYTDADGNTTIKLIKEFPIEINVSSIGYHPRQIQLTQNKDIFIKMLQLRKLMSPIEIKSVRANQDYPFTQTLISKRNLELKNLGQDIPLLLNQVPGTVINSDAGNGIGYTGIRIRGTDATRINITLNGIPYNDAESQGVFFVNLPDLVSSTSSIQVQRGVGTSTNGTGAFGASINLLTNEVEPSAYATISNSIGSFNSMKNTVKAGTGLINDRYSLDMRLSSIVSDGYVDRAKSNLKSFYISAASIKENSSLRLNIFSGKEKTYQAWYGITEDQLITDRKYNSAGTDKTDSPYNNETDNYTQTHYQLFYNKKINSQWNFNTAFFMTEGKGYYEQYKSEQDFGSYGLKNPMVNGTEISTTNLIRQLWLDNKFYGNNFSFQYKNEKNEMVLGCGLNQYNGNHFGEIIWSELQIPKNYSWYNLDAQKTEQHVFAKWLHKLDDNTNAFGDIQLRNIAYNINGFRYNPTLKIDQNWFFMNPKFGLRKKLGKFNTYISYAMANKEPNRDDFESGAKDIPKNETLHDIESGIEKTTETSKISATLYYMSYKNQLVLTGKINDVGAYTRTNIPKSYRTGIELEAEFKLTDWLKSTNNVAFSQNKIIEFTEYFDNYDDGTQKINFYKKSDIAFSPSIVGSSVFIAKLNKGFEARLISKYVGRQYLDNTSRKDRSLDAYFLQDLQFNYQIKLKEIKSIEMILQVNNLWNTLYTPNGYTYSYIYGGELSKNNFYYPMAGSNFMLGVNLNF